MLWNNILKHLPEDLKLFNFLLLLQTEFQKLRRKPVIWLMLLAAFVMPFFAAVYFRALGNLPVSPPLFYRWAAFGFTLFLLLPFILGLLCTILVHDERQSRILLQLWLVPISKKSYFLGKFFIVLLYSLCFMLLTAIATFGFGISSGCISFQWNSFFFLLEKSMELAVLAAFAILPILAVSGLQKGYLFPVSLNLLYLFLGFFLTPVNPYLHPLSAASVLLAGNGEIPGFPVQEFSVVPAVLCICLWDTLALLVAARSLKKG